MKLSELAYKRPDLEAMIEAFGKLEARAEGAQSPGELEACILEGNGLRRELIDLCNLCGIRFEEDIRVTFYAEEYEYLNSARPGVDEAYLRFRKAAAANPHRKALKEKIPEVYFQASETLVSMSSPQLLALMGEEGRLRAEYQRLIGVISIPFKGRKYTTMQMSRFFNAPDPETRQEAYKAAGEVLKRHAAPIGELFVRLVALRNEMAKLLGFDSYTQLAYRLKTRCYTPGEVEGYRSAVKKHIVPLVSRLRQAQGARLGLDRLRFSDQGVFSPGGNPRLVQAGPPFFQQTFEVLRDLCPETREMADRMLAAGTFDLDAREGKAAGGHCGYLYGIETPYVFANFSGTSFDVTSLTHECGHALAAYLAKDLPLAGELDPTYDTAAPRIGSYDMAETHSGTMEFLCWPYFERFFGEDAEKARVIHLIKTVNVLPDACVNDLFQHVVYDNPGMSFEEICALYDKLTREFNPGLDYDGLPYYSEGMSWCRVIHFFQYPFYYIDYALAYTCSLQIAAPVLEGRPREALETYLAFTKMGGTHDLLQTLDICGIDSPFKESTVEALARALGQYIDSHTDSLI